MGIFVPLRVFSQRFFCVRINTELKSMRKAEITALIIIVLSFILAVCFYPALPEKMASHWNASGEVDGYMPKFWGLFLMPFISALMLLLFIWIPKVEPLKENLEKFRDYYDEFVVLIILFLFYLYALTLFWNFGLRFSMPRFLSPAFAALFFYCGILIEKAKRNWFVGIRTPWTMTNDVVWEKTHKLGGKLFKAAALLSLYGLFVPGIAFFLVIVPAIFAALVSFFYSYFERSEKQGS